MAFDHRKYRAFNAPAKPDRKWPDRQLNAAPRWCAVDLRDGNQALVKPMSVAQKQKLFDLLVKVGFKEIEIGFPSASEPDFEFCRQLIEQDRIPADVTIQILTQARPELIARSFEALKGARRAVVHVYNSTSIAQREQVFNLDKDGIKQIAIDGATLVRDHAAQHPETEWVFQYSPESFTGTEVDYAIEVIDAVIDVWQPAQGQEVIINLPATVEMQTPNQYADLIEFVCDGIRDREHVAISLHTHNDRGCAVAAAELGVLAGADRVEGTLMGNGERTGNMDLVTACMNLYSQGIDPMVDLSGINEIRDTVEECTAISTHPRHPYVGELVFTAFSGSHQDAIRKCLNQQDGREHWDVAYLPIDPLDLGRRYEEVVRINSQSGKGGVAHVLERDFNIELPRWLQVAFSKVVQKHAEQDGGEIDSFTIRRLFESAFLDIPTGWAIQQYDIHREQGEVETKLSYGDASQRNSLAAKSDGAMSALVKALQERVGIQIEIEDYHEFAIEAGSGAEALACVRAIVNGESVSAASVGTDTTEAMLQAVMSLAGRYLHSADAEAKRA